MERGRERKERKNKEKKKRKEKERKRRKEEGGRKEIKNERETETFLSVQKTCLKKVEILSIPTLTVFLKDIYIPRTILKYTKFDATSLSISKYSSCFQQLI